MPGEGGTGENDLKLAKSKFLSSLGTQPLQLDVMLSTVHSRTFVVDKDCDTDATEGNNFCATHKDGGYDTKYVQERKASYHFESTSTLYLNFRKTGTTRTGDAAELTSEDLKGAGHSVVDTILVSHICHLF
jgi:hypothetical protein